MKRIHKMKKTISFKQFVTEFGEDFSKEMKKRLYELGTRCVLTRKDNDHTLDVKHVEHTKYGCGYDGRNHPEASGKEYAYGQFVMDGEGTMYFSKNCVENGEVMQAPVVSVIYDSLDSKEQLLDDGIRVKKVDDTNIDYVIDTILEVCPEMSPEHLAIISRY